MTNIDPSDAQVRILGSCVAPIFWLKGGPGKLYCNGTVTFFNPENPIAITNYHVYSALQDKLKSEGGQITILNLPFALTDRLIDSDKNLDLATFKITSEELKSLGKIAAVQKCPDYILPEVDMGVFNSGYPKEIRVDSMTNVGAYSFYRSGLRVKRVTPTLVTVDTTIDPGAEMVDYALKYREIHSSGGISGSPILGITTYLDNDWPILLGIVFEEPMGTELLEPDVLRVRPISCIKTDGTIQNP